MFTTCNLVLRLYMEMKSHWNNIRVSPYEIDTGTCQEIILYFFAFIMLKVHF